MRNITKNPNQISTPSEEGDMKALVVFRLVSICAIMTLLFSVAPQRAFVHGAGYTLEVHPEYDLVYAKGWQKGDQLVMILTDLDQKKWKLGPITVGGDPWHPEIPAGDFSNLFDFRPGQTLEVSGMGVSLTYLVPDPKVTEINLETDTIRGTGTPGSRMLVSPQQDFYRWTTIDQNGNWMVDFQSIRDPGDTRAYFDLRLGVSGWADEFDEFGDQTWANDWSIPYVMHLPMIIR